MNVLDCFVCCLPCLFVTLCVGGLMSYLQLSQQGRSRKVNLRRPIAQTSAPLTTAPSQRKQRGKHNDPLPFKRGDKARRRALRQKGIQHNNSAKPAPAAAPPPTSPALQTPRSTLRQLCALLQRPFGCIFQWPAASPSPHTDTPSPSTPASPKSEPPLASPPSPSPSSTSGRIYALLQRPFNRLFRPTASSTPPSPTFAPTGKPASPSIPSPNPESPTSVLPSSPPPPTSSSSSSSPRSTSTPSSPVLNAATAPPSSTPAKVLLSSLFCSICQRVLLTCVTVPTHTAHKAAAAFATAGKCVWAAIVSSVLPVKRFCVPARFAPKSDPVDATSDKHSGTPEHEHESKQQQQHHSEGPAQIAARNRKPQTARKLQTVLEAPELVSLSLQMAQQLQLRAMTCLQVTQLRSLATGRYCMQLFTSLQLWQLQRQLSARDKKIAPLKREVGHYLATTVVAECNAVQQKQFIEQLQHQLVQQAAAMASAHTMADQQSATIAQQTHDIEHLQQQVMQQAGALAHAQTIINQQAAGIGQRDRTVATMLDQEADAAVRQADVVSRLQQELSAANRGVQEKDAELLRTKAELTRVSAMLAAHTAQEAKLAAEVAQGTKLPLHVANDMSLTPGNNPNVGDGSLNYVDGAHTHLLGRHVYKWPRPQYSDEDCALEFEATMLRQLAHPFVVTLYGRCLDAEQQDPELRDRHGLILERMDIDLMKQINDNGPLPLEAIVRIGSNVAAALSFLHSQGFVHGDLKDNNIGISNVGSPTLVAKLLDFGMVKPMDSVCTFEDSMPVLARYAPPEFCAIRQAGGVEYPFGASAEVWSLGCLLADMAGIPRAVEWKDNREDVKWVQHLTGLPGHYEVLWRKAYKNGKQLRYAVEFRNLVGLCLSVNAEDRPTMRDAIELLHRLPVGDFDEVMDDFYLDEGMFPEESDSATDTDGSYSDEYDSESEL